MKLTFADTSKLQGGMHFFAGLDKLQDLHWGKYTGNSRTSNTSKKVWVPW